jgi:hypothetical protein
MIELRADGSLPGEDKIGRIYIMSYDGRLGYCSFECELESDWPEYIEKYPNFRGFVTGFLPLDELSAKHEELNAKGFTAEEQEAETVKHLKTVFLAAHRAAEKAAHAYFAACPVGPERIRASEIYDNIRNAIRV